MVQALHRIVRYWKPGRKSYAAKMVELALQRGQRLRLSAMSTTMSVMRNQLLSPTKVPAHCNKRSSRALVRLPHEAEAKTMDSNVPTERDESRAKRPSLKTYVEQVREWSDHIGGSRGAAGPCKRISPVTGEVVEVIQAR